MKTTQKYALIQIALVLAVLVCSPKLIFILANNDRKMLAHVGWTDFFVQFVFSFVFASMVPHLNNNQRFSLWKRSEYLRKYTFLNH